MKDFVKAAMSVLFIGAASYSAIGQQAPPAEISKQVERHVVITIDDLPGAMAGSDAATGYLADLQRFNRAITEALRAHKVPAIGFVNEARLQVANERDSRAALLQLWLDAGQELGNHTYSHADFSTTPVPEFEDEKVRGEVVTSALLAARGAKERYFRYPYNHTGHTAEAKNEFEAFLSARGYRVAPVTVESADYIFNEILSYALSAKDQELAEKTKEEYRAFTTACFQYYEEESKKLFGHEIPQIFVLHDSELNTETLAILLTDMEQRGYKFVALEEALADPAYSTEDRFVGDVGISWIDRWKVGFGRKPNYETSPDPPEWVLKKAKEIQKIRSSTQK